jgi:hypothetical protein
MSGTKPNSLYPTRIQKVGNINCFFLSSYKNGMLPVCSIGPTWRYAIALLLLSVIIIFYIKFIYHQLWIFQDEKIYERISDVLIVLNLIVMIMGMLCDPGIKDCIVYHYNKKQFEKSSVEMEPVVEEKDLEGIVETPAKEGPYKHIRKRRVTKQNAEGAMLTLGNFCVECNLDMEPFMDHCAVCDVCFTDHDHHCQFFGKCIAGGNQMYFDLT